MSAKKIYISLPMKGQEDTIEDRCVKIEEYVKRAFPGYEAVWPCNIKQFFGPDKTFERQHSYGWYIGEDIKLLFECEAILMTKGWEQSNGCCIEHYVANRMGMKVVFPQFGFDI